MIYHGRTYNGFTPDELAAEVRMVVEALRPHRKDFDSIVVQGLSGQCVGFPAALRLRKPICVLRKVTEDTHSVRGELVNRHLMGERVLFLDDFISEGRTLDRCRKAVEANGGRIVGTFETRPEQLTLYGQRP